MQLDVKLADSARQGAPAEHGWIRVWQTWPKQKWTHHLTPDKRATEASLMTGNGFSCWVPGNLGLSQGAANISWMTNRASSNSSYKSYYMLIRKLCTPPWHWIPNWLQFVSEAVFGLRPERHFLDRKTSWGQRKVWRRIQKTLAKTITVLRESLCTDGWSVHCLLPQWIMGWHLRDLINSYHGCQFDTSGSFHSVRNLSKQIKTNYSYTTSVSDSLHHNWTEPWLKKSVQSGHSKWFDIQSFLSSGVSTCCLKHHMKLFNSSEPQCVWNILNRER